MLWRRKRTSTRPVNGWRVVVGGSVLLTSQNGLILSAFGAYLVSITAESGWDAGAIAIAYSIVQLGNGFLAPLIGWCCDRFGTRLVSQAGTVLTAGGFALASIAGSGGHFIGAVVIVALGCSAAGIMPLTVAVVQSITERRTLALGLLPTGVALGGLLVPVVTLTLEALGWRMTFLAVAVATVVVGLLSSITLPGVVKARGTAPQHSQPLPGPPDEVPAEAALDAAAAEAGEVAGVDPRDSGHDLRAAVRTSAFWLLVVGHGSALIAISAMNLHLAPLITHGHGFSLGAAGVAIALMSVAQLIGQIATGLIGDRLDKRLLAVGYMVLQAVVLVAFTLVSSLPLVMLLAIVHGLAWGLRGPMMTALRADYFGLGSFGTIMGWSMGFVSVGLVIGPILVSALVAGAGGSYTTALLALAGTSILGATAFLVLRPPRPLVAAAGVPAAAADAGRF